MVLQRWEPFRELRRMEERMDRLWKSLGATAEEEGSEAWLVPLDVYEEDSSIVVRASVPGVKPDDLHVTVEDDILTIKGETESEREVKKESYLLQERRAGSFFRSLRLPSAVDSEKAQSSYDSGVLTITFPKVESKKAKHIKVVPGPSKVIEGAKK